MRKKSVIFTVVLALAALTLLVFAQYQHGDERFRKRIWHHEQAANADPAVGAVSIPTDGMVDESFVTHLPLVIIDTFGEEIINYKYWNFEYNSFVYPENIDPYVDITLSVIDSPEYVNTPLTAVSMETNARIKVRGNSSASTGLLKRQYLIKLKTEDGEKSPLSVLGMEASDTWVLNGTTRDKSYLRNYISFNTAGELDPFTPDMRFCEVLLRRDDGYEYLGLYGMYEKVEQGEGRVDITPVSNPIGLDDYSYIVQRDRKDPGGLSMDTYSNELHNSESWINLEYPSPENVPQEYWEYIQQDIQKVEDALYAEDKNTFLGYRNLLDVDSFVDYFLLNEYFASYDAGMHSTFLYKNADGKIAVGPVWDFDNAMDNYQPILLDVETMPFLLSPWFEALVRDPGFNSRLVARYRELREGILSNEVICGKLQAAEEFIHYPALRDSSRWAEQTSVNLPALKETNTELLVAREQESPEKEMERVENTLILHAKYLDDHMSEELAQFEDRTMPIAQMGGWLLIIGFFVSVILVQRIRRGQ